MGIATDRLPLASGSPADMISRASQSTVETEDAVEYLLDVDDVEEEEVKWDEGFRMTIVCFFLPKVSLNARVRCPSLSASLIFVNASLDGETCSLTVPCCVPVLSVSFAPSLECIGVVLQ